MSFIEARQLRKSYASADHEVEILKGINLGIEKGEFISLMGPSGAGKSTLLQLLGALDRPSAGEIIIDGKDLSRMSDKELTLFRRRRLGFIFQFFNLMPTLNVLENAALPCFLDGKSLSSVRGFATETLERLGLGHRLDHRPHQLSGGEMQRVAIARALVNKPSLILADEPTGNLDSKNGAEVLSILKNLVKDFNVTLVMVTHDKSAAEVADRKVQLLDGVVV
ncbi:MAG: ABC transporter ATP-binding protein [Proteobacteria bacterium]|jgi:putative ABC transport system ATP-binding protein|nr:ABC transporter ATP-binding protein [Pseudomonadota bacterium]